MGATRARLILEASIRSSASEYFDSNPGRSSQSVNHSLHNNLWKVLKYQSFKLEELHQLLSQVRYRLSTVRPATRCKDILKFSFPACAQFDMDAWYTKTLVQGADRDEAVRSRAKERLKRWMLIESGANIPNSWDQRPRVAISQAGEVLRCRYLGVFGPPQIRKSHAQIRRRWGFFLQSHRTNGRFILISCSEKHVDAVTLKRLSGKAVGLAV